MSCREEFGPFPPPERTRTGEPYPLKWGDEKTCKSHWRAEPLRKRGHGDAGNNEWPRFALRLLDKRIAACGGGALAWTHRRVRKSSRPLRKSDCSKEGTLPARSLTRPAIAGLLRLAVVSQDPARPPPVCGICQGKPPYDCTTDDVTTPVFAHETCRPMCYCCRRRHIHRAPGRHAKYSYHHLHTE